MKQDDDNGEVLAFGEPETITAMYILVARLKN